MSLLATELANIEPGTVALIKPDTWFFGDDGKSYAAVYGPCYVIPADKLLGLAPKNSSNWYLQVGEGDKTVVLAGCQCHYAGLFPKCPPNPEIFDTTK